MLNDFAYCKEKINQVLCSSDMGLLIEASYSLQMAKKPVDDPNIDFEADEVDPSVNHLRAWREFRGLKQAELAEKVGTSESVISLLEKGRRKLSPKWLRMLAPALDTTPGFILDHDPNELPTDMLDLWSKVSPEDRPRALEAIKIFVSNK